MARLGSAVLVTSLTRRAFQSGGSAAIICKGDESAGEILLILTEKGHFSGLFERVRDHRGRAKWIANQRFAGDRPITLDDYLTARRRSDPDLWIIELDISDAARFVADMTTGD